MNEDEKRDLKKRTSEFARRIIRLYSRLDKNCRVSQVIGGQILRSGTSVGANYREAFRSRSTAEFVAKLGDCLKELDETQYWLELMRDEQIFTENQLGSLLNESNELIAIFVSSINTAKKQKTS